MSPTSVSPTAFWDLGQYRRVPDADGPTCPDCGRKWEFYSPDGRSWNDGDRVSCVGCGRHYEIVPDGLRQVEGPHR